MRFTALAVAVVALVAAAPIADTAYKFTMTSIDGKPMPFAQYRGKVLLVVNTASFCGFTPQYEGLEALYEGYRDQGLVLVGVPSGDFKNQEYGSNKEIKQFCESKFGIRFPMTEKAGVVGPNAAPFYKWAEAKLGPDSVPKWNFHKSLVGRDGTRIAYFGSRTTPDDPALKAAIEAALAAKG